MAFEFAAYGALTGVMHGILPKKKPYVYVSLLTAMIVGRLVWGAAMFVCTGIGGGEFTFAAFIAGAFTNAVPGIILQLILVPILVMILDDSKVVKSKD